MGRRPRGDRPDRGGSAPSSPPGRPRLRKALGQHHLVDGALCRPLIDFLRIGGAGKESARRVLEVGPGGGVLTAELLAAGAAPLLAWELDLAWAAEARRDLAGAGGAERLHLVVGDALELPWERLPVPTRVAGNLPYNVGTRILLDLLPHGERIPRAAFLVQREVAERLVARPGDPAYGSLSVLVAAWSAPRLLGRVRPGSFRPPPKVESAFVGLELRSPPLPREEMPAFAETVRLAFGRRRKTLRNALAAGWGREGAAAALERAGLDAGVRAEALGVEELVALHRQAGSVGREPAV